MRKIPKTNFLDKLHRGVVIACIGLTAYGTVLIGHKVYRYFTVVKPQREISEFKLLEVNHSKNSKTFRRITCIKTLYF